MFPRDLWGMPIGFAMRDSKLGSVFIGGAIAERSTLNQGRLVDDRKESPLELVLQDVGVPAVWLRNYRIVLKCGRCLLVFESTSDDVIRARRHLSEICDDTVACHLLRSGSGTEGKQYDNSL